MSLVLSQNQFPLAGGETNNTQSHTFSNANDPQFLTLAKADMPTLYNSTYALIFEYPVTEDMYRCTRYVTATRTPNISTFNSSHE